MTTVAQNFEFSQFAFLNNQSKKTKHNLSYNGSQKPCGQQSRGNSNNFSYKPQSLKQYSGSQQTKRFTDNKKATYNNDMRFENQYNFNRFAKATGPKVHTDDYARTPLASTASESDSYNTSELAGFKIVSRGRVLHDEIEDDFDSEFEMKRAFKTQQGDRFASSLMTIGPNSKDISLPTFV